MSDLVKFGGNLPANPEALIKGLQNVSSEIQGSTGGTPFLRLLKSGIYAYGPESIEPEEGSEWAMNPNSLMHGFACWGDGELLDERMVPFTQAAPSRADLPDYGHPWDQQVSMTLQCLNGEDEGVSVLYKGTSTGLRTAVKELINELIAQLQTDQEHCVPVLDLGADSYNHKKYGEIFFPVLTISRWVSFGGADDAPDEDQTEAAPAADAQEPDPDPAAKADDETAAPRRRRRRAAAADDTAPAEEAEPDAAPPRRRRRRSA